MSASKYELKDRTSPTTHTQDWHEWRKYIGSIGKLLPNMEAMIVDEEGREVETGKDGELWMRGPNVFAGYLNNEEATRNSLTQDGWFKSGDVGHIDADGYSLFVQYLMEECFILPIVSKSSSNIKVNIH